MSAPTQQQIADAIIRVHKALHEWWPPASIFHGADINAMTKMAWEVQWHKAREGWRDQVEKGVEQMALAPTVKDLDHIVRVACEALEESAKNFQEEMAKLLDDEPG